MFIQQYISNPSHLDQLCHKNPSLAELIVNNDVQEIANILRKKDQEKLQKQRKIDAEIARLQSNPFDPESQKRIEEMIKEKRLNELQNQTYEHHPELFVSTEMLYINASVNNTAVQVFVDTGAQTTVISREFAERANLMKNVDARFKGLIKGVGEQTSLGRIWNFSLKINGKMFAVSAVVLEKFSHEILLGLDAMKRHKVIINLGEMQMGFPSHSITVPFLKDHEIIKIPLEEFSKKIQKILETVPVDDKKASMLLKKHNYDENAVIQNFFNNN
jgi:DNA damage-inducible protein 1